MPELNLLLRLSRITYLRPRERIAAAYHLQKESALRGISLGELSQLVRRPLAARRYADSLTEFDLQRDLEALDDGSLSLVSFFDEGYPRRLRHIFDPPLLLYCRGNRELLRRLDAVSVVGTRRATIDALEATRRLGEAAAAAGHPVVSGLARGIDGAAHRGALHAPGGRTVAVLGSAVDRLYPQQNQPLAREILAAGGLIISEYPPGTPARKYHFPERNRIIAGVSELIWVIQAPRGSGALITADYGLEHNREVVCHTVGTAPGSRNVGTRSLAADGAGVWDSWEAYLGSGNWPPLPPEEASTEDLLKEWGYLDRGESENDPGDDGGETRRPPGSPRKRRRRSRVARKSAEMLDGQQLLSLFTGDEEELEA